MFRWLHSIGVFFIFLAGLLLLVTSISAPVVGRLAILKVDFTNRQTGRPASITFGSFGHCLNLDANPSFFASGDRTYCSGTHVGYSPGTVMRRIDGGLFRTHGEIDDLTHGFILHPFASAFAFIAGFASIGGVIGSLIGSVIAFIAWVLTLTVLIVDILVFNYVQDSMSRDRSGSRAHFSVAMWSCIGAFIFLFFGAVIVFATCCTSRHELTGKRSTTKDAAPAKRVSWRKGKE